MTALIYKFDNVNYVLEDAPTNGATLTITWTNKLWARFEFQRDGSSIVTTAAVPRFFNAFTIMWAQQRYAAIIKAGKGSSAFKILQAHFDARKLYQGIRNS
jgi:hypothetical protein